MSRYPGNSSYLGDVVNALLGLATVADLRRQLDKMTEYMAEALGYAENAYALAPDRSSIHTLAIASRGNGMALLYGNQFVDASISLRRSVAMFQALTHIDAPEASNYPFTLNTIGYLIAAEIGAGHTEAARKIIQDTISASDAEFARSAIVRALLDTARRITTEASEHVASETVRLLRDITDPDHHELNSMASALSLLSSALEARAELSLAAVVLREEITVRQRHAASAPSVSDFESARKQGIALLRLAELTDGHERVRLLDDTVLLWERDLHNDSGGPDLHPWLPGALTRQ